jgi:inner membrane protein
MDNLTHSLVGALIGQMGLKRKTGLAMPTLIIAANIPDIDAVATLLGGQQHLALRRGLTHGPIAMLVLPLLLWGIMLWFDQWQAKRGKRPDTRLPIDKGWLLALAYIGCLSHPLFDWFNSYGIRLLEPFSSQWFYGDTLFIIDIWLWAMLGSGIWLSLRRERREQLKPGAPAILAMFGLVAYVIINIGISLAAVAETRRIVPQASMVVANPVPFSFWKREVLVRTDSLYGSRSFVPLLAPKGNKGPQPLRISKNSIYELSKHDSHARAFLFWSRMPIAELRRNGSDQQIEISDQRFEDELVRGRFTVVVPLRDSVE